MLDIRYIKERPDEVIARLAKKGKDAKNPEDDKKFLRAYATDLTEKARLGRELRPRGGCQPRSHLAVCEHLFGPRVATLCIAHQASASVERINKFPRRE